MAMSHPGFDYPTSNEPPKPKRKKLFNHPTPIMGNPVSGVPEPVNTEPARCPPHYCDNQGLCHYCGILMEPEWYRAYAGEPHPDEGK